MALLLQVANFDVVREKFGGSAAMMALHDKMADVLLTATALSAESPGTRSPSINKLYHEDHFAHSDKCGAARRFLPDMYSKSFASRSYLLAELMVTAQ